MDGREHPPLARLSISELILPAGMDDIQNDQDPSSEANKTGSVPAHSAWHQISSRETVGIVYRTTSQCPPLSGPMRRRRPPRQRRFSCHATPLSVMPRVTASSSVVRDGVFRRKFRIFSLVSSPVLTPASDGNGMTVTNGSPSMNRGLAPPPSL